MMSSHRQLQLLRHAKSSWDEPGLADHDRPLAPRGRRAAARIGRHLREARGAPALILCSSARRAQETLALLELEAPVSVEQELYGASTGGLLERIRRVPPELQSLLVIGHNPELQSLAIELAAEGSLRMQLHAKFPTGALATLEFDGPWHGLGWGAGQLAAFVRPRELED
jgi:phosphohistidine phosphatase